MKTKLIGLAGNATVGKDTFCKLLTEINPKFKRFAFADWLKHEVDDILSESFGLDVFNDNDKKIAREFLVAWGCLRRETSNGLYWIDVLKKDIDVTLSLNLYKNAIPVITDVRFATYDYDELNFIKENGILVYIDKRKGGNLVKPANDKEAYNNPILKRNADYLFEWDDCNGHYDLVRDLYFNKVKEFNEWYQTKL